MDKIRLGKTGLMVTRLGFGGIPIQRLSDNEATEVVKGCLDLGIQFLDTANAYTTSEGCVGRAIAGKRDNLIISTKSSHRKKDGMRRHLELSLKHLGVDYVDLYNLHNVSTLEMYDQAIAPGGVLEAAQEAKQAGLIRHIGITCHTMEPAQKAVASGLFETVMFSFNFVGDDAKDKLLPLCRQHDVGFIVMKAMAGGVLQDATIALKWLMQFPDIAILLGVDKLSHMEEAVRIMNGPAALTADEQRKIQQIKDELGPTFCHRCDYCQPCKEKVSISMVLSQKSFHNRMPPAHVFKGWIADALESGFRCVQCGECEPRCPYKLPIRDMIQEYTEFYSQKKAAFDRAMVNG
ncbi:MAG: aldo/keto reductase [Dehalococcoidia bacterium]|nr:aldo/keto reductase [Dehalococcoidia bacterium]